MSDVNVVYFYSVEDDKANNIKHKHLEALMREKGVSLRSQKSDMVGEEYDKKIIENIKSAHIIVLFYSSDFYPSDFYTNYISLILEQSKSSNTQLVAVRLRSYTHIETDEDYNLDFFPSRDKSLMQSVDLDEAWSKLVEKIKLTYRKSNAAQEEKYSSLVNLCNRERQYLQLNTALNIQKQKAADRDEKLTPLVCFIHGSPQENIEEYKERLRNHDLIRLLKLNPTNGQKITHREIWWEDYELADWLQQRLGEEVCDDLDAKVDDIARELGNHPYPFVISYRMDANDWQNLEKDRKEPGKIIRDFLDFWNKLPPVTSQNTVIICFFFEHKTPNTLTTQKNNEHQKEESSREFFKSLNGNTDFENLCVVVLDELPWIGRKDVEKWITKTSDHEAYQYYWSGISVRMVRAQVGDLYLDPNDENPKLPMKELEKKLINFLSRANRY